jgi:uridine kinase
MIAKIKFSSEAEKRAYVEECDADFEARLDTVVKALCQTEGLKYLTLSGPTCSGKTTASKKLVSEFSERGKTVKIISLDDFFRNRTALETEASKTGGKLDFDSEKALDLEELASFMNDIQDEKETRLPRFDFVSAKRSGYEKFSCHDADIIVFEGIQAIYPAFTSLFRADTKIKSFYISPMEELCVGDKVLSPREIRLWRRLVRDYKYRSAGPEFTFLLWEGVTENEDKNILPYVDNSDFKINSVLGYEPCMLKAELSEILLQVKKDSKYYKKSTEILEAIEKIDTVSEKYLPENSLYHEFI